MMYTYMKTFLLLHEFQDSFNMLTDEEAGQLIKAIFTYEKTGEEPDFEDRAMNMAFLNIKRFLDSNRENYERTCKRRAESASKRWGTAQSKAEKAVDEAMQKDANACNCMQMDAFAGNTNVNSDSDVKPESNSDVNVKSDTDVNSPAPEKQSTGAEKDNTQTHKSTYGEFKNVLLTAEEHKRLTERFPDALSRIESLSAYMKSTGKAYLDHYAQLINWHPYASTPPVKGNGVNKKPPGERREPTFDVSAFTKKAVGIKYVPPEEQ